MKVAALIFAGGVGSRMKNESMPKQFLEWNGKAIIIHTLEVFETQENVDSIVVACKEDWIDYTKELIEKAGLRKVLSVVPGGISALESQYNGLLEIKRLYQDEKVAVLIHDGVRPLVDHATIQRNIDSVRAHGNAITVAKAIETVIQIGDDGIEGIMDRSSCRVAKAPQSFLLDQILDAHNMAIRDGRHDFIDSASLMMAYGYRLHPVDGEPENIKITTPSDYYMFLGISRNRNNP